MASDKKIKEFAGKLFVALAAEYWGLIDPDIFDVIATQHELEWSDEAAKMFECLKKAFNG